jgi:hypothetical protein
MQFELDALVTELELIRTLAEPFIEPDSFWELARAGSRLRALPVGNPKSSWSIEEPLRTIPSPGAYKQGGAGELTIRANVRTLWEITRADRNIVTVRDNVSTSVSITTEPCMPEGPCEIAGWTMDIAAVESAPGCGLHAQVKESEAWFPKGLDVPRLPMFIPTLGAVLEFVLGELFQSDWTKRVGSHAKASSWRALQCVAWERWLNWQRRIVSTGSVSPWLDIKARRCAELNDH